MNYLKSVIAAVAASFFTLPVQAEVIAFSSLVDAGDEQSFGVIHDLNFDAGVMRIAVEQPHQFDIVQNLFVVGQQNGTTRGLGVCTFVQSAASCATDDDRALNPWGVDEPVETVTVSLLNNATSAFQTVDITQLSFRGLDGGSLNASTDTVRVTVFGDNTVLVSGEQFTFADLTALALADNLTGVTAISFFAPSTSFFLESITLADMGNVPLPAALPLFLCGLAGLGFSAQRRAIHH